ncbi:putative metal-binding motif-containing protein, partial [Hyphomicrobium sp.]|uniref:putative metal-binding motif-containing protein n=1 Tax=Hyphomicrobium sp. TaxID=82 RepID=UPI0025BFA1B1
GSCLEPATDCDDLDESRFPDAVEWCDGADQDCDGVSDNGACEVVALAPVVPTQPIAATHYRLTGTSAPGEIAAVAGRERIAASASADPSGGLSVGA